MKTTNAKNPLAALNTFLAQLVAGAESWLVRVETGRRRTTGVVYRVAEGEALILTAAHILAGDDTVQIATGDEPLRPARLAGWDPRTDLALLRAEAGALTAAPFAASDAVQAGHLVLTLGRPGRRVRATLGMVSAVGGPWQTGHGADIARFLDIDGRLPEGFSGGVLADAEGRVLGVNTHALIRGGTTLPTETVQRVADLLAARGHMPRGHLGLGTQPVALAAALAEAEGQGVGLVVVNVEPEGPADRAGVLLGDVLLALGGRRVQGHGDLVGARDAAAGRSVEARVLRAGALTTLEVEVGERDGPGPEIPQGRCGGGGRRGRCG